MEDMNLFDRFHAAFEEAPPGGAFERLQSDLIKHSAAQRARPAFHMRWSRMSLRLTAAVAVVVIVIALVAAYIVAQRPATSSLPAGPTTAYKNLISSDHDALRNTYSTTACIKYRDTTCAPAIAGIKTALQAWLNDLRAERTPPQLRVIDTQLRLHLSATFEQMNLALQAIAAQDERAFLIALDIAGGHEAPWIDRMADAIVLSRGVSATDYKYLVSAVRANLESCACCQDLAGRGFSGCAGPKTDICKSDVDEVSDQVGIMLAGLVQTAAPAEFGTKGAQLEAHLAVADTALLKMEIALQTSDFATLGAERAKYQTLLPELETDLAAILNS